MEKKFNRGDSVKLKSGTMKMTVLDYWMDNSAQTMEFIRTRNKEKANLIEPVLTSKVLCEYLYQGKLTQGKFEQDNLELIDQL